MKKLFIIILLVIATSANAANYYFDLASGNDSTGDGSYGNPWKTIDKCTTSRTAGDECRCAKSTITTLSGTLTFTNGSTSVTTSVDQSAVVAAGDLISKNSGLEGWWKVSSVAAGAITLSYQYWGLSGSGSAVTGYKITPITASEEYDVNTSGTSSSAYMKISGGWDLSNQTQDGITSFSSSFTNGVDFNSKNYVELSKFIITVGAGTYYPISINGYNNYIHDCFFIPGTSNCFNYWKELTHLKDISITGGGSIHHYNIQGSNSLLENCYSFSASTSTSYGAFNIDTTSNTLMDNCRAYNANGFGFKFNSCGNVFAKNCISDTVRSGNNVLGSGVARYILFYNFTASGASSRVATYGYPSDFRFIESNLTAGGSGLFYESTIYRGSVEPDNSYKPVGGDLVLYYADGTIEQDSSAECRSGKCLKFTPSSTYAPLVYKVGNVRIPSAGSDLTVSAYIKDDVSHNGQIWFVVSRNGKWLSMTEKTTTTSYVKESVVVSSSDLVVDEYIDLYVVVTGTAGNVYVDDFSAEQ